MAATRPGIFFGGLRLLFANKRTLLWSYLALLFVGVVGGASTHARFGPFLDHSLAAQRLAGTLDLAYYDELFMHANEHDPGSGPVTAALTLLSVLVAFFFAAGFVYVFLTGEKPRLAIVLGRGIEYFWRFFRLLLFAAIIGGPILGVLGWLRSVYLKSVDEKFVEAAYDIRAGITLVVLLLVAVVLRLWFDLAEVYVVKLGIAGDRRVRKSLGPSLRLLRRNFFRAFFSYFAAGTLGWLAFTFFFWIWIGGQASHLVFAVFFWSQIALVFLLASRIWQRGIVTALVLAEPSPVVVVVEPIPVIAVVPETEPVAVDSRYPEESDPVAIDPEFVGQPLVESRLVEPVVIEPPLTEGEPPIVEAVVVESVLIETVAVEPVVAEPAAPEVKPADPGPGRSEKPLK